MRYNEFVSDKFKVDRINTYVRSSGTDGNCQD